ncbi:E3 ubiquitin-protein ligase TRIM56-like [Littorina saxatilis]|uniref:E3 ubiquitin-protein ligase TRIM56-like n=1 Tax=Littorina saxatilis TaxID=31220 RepID=UPI0038B6022E
MASGCSTRKSARDRTHKQLTMASVVDLESKFLECHICLETYRRPKTIPCLHSFCEQCLQDYISNSREVQETCFPCPVCKQFVDIPDPSLPKSQWGSSFKGSFFLNDLADCLKQAASPVLTAPCSLCDRNNAVKFCLDCDHRLCGDCFLLHRKIPTSSNHEVVDHSHCNSPQVHRRRKRFCHAHTDRVLELYCPQCSTPLCQMCHLTFHKLCPGVTPMSETAEKKRVWLKELEGRTSNYIHKLSRINDHLNRNLEAANMAKVSDAERLKEFFIKTMHTLHKKQDELMAELEKTYKNHCKALVEGKRDREELLTALCNARDLTHSLVEVGSDLEVMQEADSDLGLQVQGLIRRVDTLPRPETPVASMALDGEAARGVSKNLNKLSLTVTLSSPIPTTPTTDSPTSGAPPFAFPTMSQRRTPKLLKRIKTRTGLDKEKPEIWDMTVLPAGQLILVDAGNSCLKGMNMGPSATTVCRLSLRSPLRVCKLSDTEVAVTGQDKKLYIIQVSDKLEATRITSTQHEYWGLASVGEETLAASCLDLSCVHLIDLSGKVLQTISHDASMNPLFLSPSYLSSTPDGDILVSDCVKKCIYRLGVNGEVRFKYPCNGPFGLLNPRSLCADPQGPLLCVDKEGQKVVRLSTLGRFAGSLLTTIHGLSYPEAVTVGPRGVVYVTSDAMQTDTQDVLVFEIL